MGKIQADTTSRSKYMVLSYFFPMSIDQWNLTIVGMDCLRMLQFNVRMVQLKTFLSKFFSVGLSFITIAHVVLKSKNRSFPGGAHDEIVTLNFPELREELKKSNFFYCLNYYFQQKPLEGKHLFHIRKFIFAPLLYFRRQILSLTLFGQRKGFTHVIFGWSSMNLVIVFFWLIYR